ncbi:replication initiator protein A [Pseudoalteromonas sp. GutCa3]|uniref:replication initiator protein A n=1 Tax=Pseudoalteromonas sp. GutCa3 TaxID=888433 RepID=UPI001E3D07C1|nr:replication initiator protein A [Pseudoalteromonas sp. GutCa3]
MKDLIKKNIVKLVMPNINLRSDFFSTDLPIFALDGKSKEAVEFTYKGTSVKVMPSIIGRATIKDKEIIIYCLSHLVALKNAQLPFDNTVYLNPYDFLKFTGRGTSGKEYNHLNKALCRLAGTSFTTDYDYKGKGRIFLQSSRFIEKFQKYDDAKSIYWQIILPEWLLVAINDGDILTLHQDYFQLSSPFERRIYEVCRRQCGDAPVKVIESDCLRKLIGVKLSQSAFNRRIKNLKILFNYKLVLNGNTVFIYNDIFG